MVDSLLSKNPSLAVKVNESELAKLLLVKVTVFPLRVVPAVITLSPFPGSVKFPVVKVVILKIVGVVPSGSVAVNIILVGFSSVRTISSPIAIGASLT